MMSNSYFPLILLRVGICSLVWSHMFGARWGSYVPTGTCLVYIAQCVMRWREWKMPFSFNLLDTASAKGWYRNEVDNLKAGCVSTNCVHARLPQDTATTDQNSALYLSFLVLLRGLAWNSSDNPLVFLSHWGKYPPACCSLWFTVLIMLSHQLWSPVEWAAPISGPPSPTSCTQILTL